MTLRKEGMRLGRRKFVEGRPNRHDPPLLAIAISETAIKSRLGMGLPKNF
jgi:hypothetical protein